MKLVYFTHSLESCWNHGNAHFLRGVLRELIAAGVEVAVFEPADGWSRQNLLADQGAEALSAYRAAYPELASTAYSRDIDLAAVLDGADVVVVHEWNEEWLVRDIAALRRSARFLLLFHDTHHRLISAPETMPLPLLEGFDGVLAFGEALAAAYRSYGWGDRAIVWHEAADTRLFRPPSVEGRREGLVWIGNWGDGERTAELQSFLLRPAQSLGMRLDIHGVRYPDEALRTLKRYGAAYRGWIANAEVPACFARHLATVHVPRRFYVERLPGIPTIRVFEALACGIPLVSAPWEDSEGLFEPGRDFLMARSEAEMTELLAAVRADAGLRRSLAESGLRLIRSRHGCAHRARELVEIVSRLTSRPAMEAA